MGPATWQECHPGLPYMRVLLILYYETQMQGEGLYSRQFKEFQDLPKQVWVALKNL